MPPPLNPTHDVYQPNQHWHLHQRAHRTCQCLAAIRPVYRHHDGNRKFKIVTRSRERLRAAGLVLEAELLARERRGSEDDEEVYDQRSADSENRGDGVDDFFALGREEDDDGVEEAD